MRKKMYKVGKHWVAAAVAIAGIGLAGGASVSADQAVSTETTLVNKPTTDPVTPEVPSQPVEEEKDVAPTTPNDEAETPTSVPTQPVVPTAPDEPENPTTPENPTVPSTPEIADGVNKEDGLYYQDGEVLTGIAKADGKMYEAGKLLSGVSSVDKKMYKNGVLFNGTLDGLLYVDGVKFSGTKNGILYVNGVKFNGTKDGVLYENGAKYNGTKNGVLYVNGVKFSGTKDGVLYVNGAKFNGTKNGKVYKNGVLLTGKHSDGKFYQNGVVLTGYNGNTYYVNGVAANGYMADNTKTKYLFKDGVKQAGRQKIDGTYYFFDFNTKQMVKHNYVQAQDGNWYMFGEDGKIVSDVYHWAGTYYYFDHNTFKKHTNSYDLARWGDWYMFGADGRILTDVVKWAGSYYYFDHNTYTKHTNSYDLARWGDWYMFDGSGRVISGYKYWYGQLYYFHGGTFTKAVNQHVYENGNRYWANGSGHVTVDWTIDNAINIGSTLVGHSPYVWGGGRNDWSIARREFDCSSFVHWSYANAGLTLEPVGYTTTYSQVNRGRGVNWCIFRRGDLIFFGSLGHVGLYLGGGYFLHDSPNSPTGGVGVSHLNDIVNQHDARYSWASIADTWATRRVQG